MTKKIAEYTPDTTNIIKRKQDLLRRKMMDEAGADIVVAFILTSSRTQYFGAQTFYP